MNKVIIFMGLFLLMVIISGCFHDNPTSDSKDKETPKPNVNLQISLEKPVIFSGGETKLFVTISGDIVEGDLSVTAINGNQYLLIITNEDTHIKLGDKSSSVKKIYTITGNTDVTVEPDIEAVLNTIDGQIIKSNQVSLRVKDLV